METEHTTHTQHTRASNTLALPIAIVLAGAMIAGSLYLVGRNTTTPGGTIPTTADVPKVTSADHILGNPNADVIVVEYTDLECPFCKQFHGTMKQILASYGADGKVAWVVRNFPLSTLHPNALRLAEAAECVATIGGNEAYFKYLDKLFDKAPLNEKTDMSRIAEYATLVGVDTTAFNDCLTKASSRPRIEKDFKDAVASGGQGTPYNVILSKDGSSTPLSGAQPYATVKSVIDTLLAK